MKGFVVRNIDLFLIGQDACCDLAVGKMEAKRERNILIH